MNVLIVLGCIALVCFIISNIISWQAVIVSMKLQQKALEKMEEED